MGSDRLFNYTIARWEVPGAESWPEEIAAEEAEHLTRVPNLGQIGHYAQIADMVGVVRDGRPPAVTGAEGREALRITLALYESSRTGQEVTLS